MGILHGIDDNHGGDEGIRTPDLLRAKQALFQLSYAPRQTFDLDMLKVTGGSWWTRTTDLCLIRAALSPSELKTLDTPTTRFSP